MRTLLVSAVLFFVTTSLFANATTQEDRDIATAMIDICADSYVQLAQRHLATNDSEAAESYLLGAATALATNMFLNKEGGVVPNERTAFIESLRVNKDERDLETNTGIVTECAGKLPDDIRGTLYGMSFTELKRVYLLELKKQFGI